MRKYVLLSLSLCFLVFACKKGDNASPANNNNNNNNNNSTYYFKLNVDGTDYNLISTLAQYMSIYPEDAGGYQMANALSYPSAGIRFSYDSAVSDTQVKALAGKTIYFNQTNPHPSVTFGTNPAGEDMESVDTANTAFNIKITSVTYLKKDTTVFNPVDAYVLKGTCSAVLQDPTTKKMSTLSSGEFNYIISRVDK